MSETGFKVCGEIVSSDFEIEPSDLSSAVSLTHTGNSKLSIQDIIADKIIAVRLKFTLGYAVQDPPVTVVFENNYESTLMIGDCVRTL